MPLSHLRGSQDIDDPIKEYMNRWFTSKQPDHCFNHFDGFPIYMNKCAFWYRILLKYTMILRRPRKIRLRDLLLVEQIDGVFSISIHRCFFQLAPFKSEIQIMIFLDLTLREIGKSDFLFSRPI